MQITWEKVKNYIDRYFTGKGLKFGIDETLEVPFVTNPKTQAELLIEVNESFNYMCLTLVPDGTCIEINFDKKELNYNLGPGQNDVTKVNVNCWQKLHKAISMLLIPVSTDLSDEFRRQQFQTACKAYYADGEFYQSAANPNYLHCAIPTGDITKDVQVHLMCILPGEYFEEKFRKPVFHVNAWRFVEQEGDKGVTDEVVMDEYFEYLEDFSMALKKLKAL